MKKNRFAEKIIEIAKQKNIPISDDPELLKILFKLDLGEDVPLEVYKVITEILAFVCRVSNKSYSEI
jgi:flagellar biosynthesis protein